MIGHGLHTALETNPVEGMFIQTNKSRKTTTNPYQPFTSEALATLFGPKAYLAAKDAPDCSGGLCWVSIPACASARQLKSVVRRRRRFRKSISVANSVVVLTIALF